MAENPDEEQKRKKEETKKKIVLSILNLYAKNGGATLHQINKDYLEQEGERLAPTQSEGIRFMASMENVQYNDNSKLYRSCSILSQHIKKFVTEQNVKISSNYMGNRNNLNRSFPSRPITSYRNDYADVTFPSNTNAGRPAGKIQSRRKTLGPACFKRSHSPEPAKKRPRSSTPEKDKPSTSKRNRSRSKSRQRDDRSPARRSPPRWQNRCRDISPRSAISPERKITKDKMGFWTSNRSRSPARSSSHRRSRSPNRRRSRSRRSRSRPSPKRTKRSQSPSDWSSRSSSHNKHSNSPNNGGRQNSPPPSVPRNVQSSNSETNAATHSNQNDQTAESKAKKFKFTVVGDGFMYYMLYDMQPDAKSHLALCNHNLLISDAKKLVHQQREILKEKKRKVIISLGASDLRSNRKFSEMRRDITGLFLMCHEYKLKPLITTILCFDNIELKRKADLFNQFLFECFENVVDMRDVMKSGLSEVMTAMNKKNAMKPNKKTLELGAQQQLVLKVPNQ
ncbi:serine/arginine-rich splicing factor 4-like isoform X2 [Contarinia nasturtii]|uniref:serine/arginine-rich splicing factor 4-like isoform X2 n=1 Tax=Contarinia nasturtii TaxID=265458 RepID=UPI0012D453EE|nr:serine/arginine-rich splicing factor 4-like isoform X2 [Contarinia nasturtii]